ncbi:hypothetical protein H0H81_005737, partial [Sphagnurus paluster]
SASRVVHRFFEPCHSVFPGLKAYPRYKNEFSGTPLPSVHPESAHNENGPQANHSKMMHIEGIPAARLDSRPISQTWRMCDESPQLGFIPMTEYEYSLEGYEGYLHTQQCIARWVDHTEEHRRHFSRDNSGSGLGSNSDPPPRRQSLLQYLTSRFKTQQQKHQRHPRRRSHSPSSSSMSSSEGHYSNTPRAPGRMPMPMPRHGAIYAPPLLTAATLLPSRALPQPVPQLAASPFLLPLPPPPTPIRKSPEPEHAHTHAWACTRTRTALRPTCTGPPPYFHPQPQTFYPTSNPNPHLAKIVPRPRMWIRARLPNPKTCARLLPPTPEQTPATGLKSPYAPRSSNTRSPSCKVLTNSMPWARIRLHNIADLADC